jgi:hypothetical protein
LSLSALRAYKAANWIHVGQTLGRDKPDVMHECAMPIKEIWLYPLEKSFRWQPTAQPCAPASGLPRAYRKNSSGSRRVRRSFTNTEQ